MTSTQHVQFSRPEKELAAMTAKELEQLQVQWYAEATRRGVLPIIAKVARELGQSLSVRYGPKYEWRADSPDGEIAVYVDDYGGYFTVHVRGKPVVSTHECTRLFVPGAWLEPILALHQLALDKAAARVNEGEESKRSRLLETLGAFGE